MAANMASPARWVLGLDISSARAKGLETEVLEATCNRVNVARLRSAELRLFRNQASVGDHTRAAVLFHVGPESVQAWSGGQIAVQLARLLGPMSAWRLLQLVGSDLMSDGASVESPSRRKLSRSLAGAAVMAGLLLTIGVDREHAGAQELTQPDGSSAMAAALDLEPQGGIDPEGKKTRWTVEEPDNKVKRRMEDKWRGDELRAYHDWLGQHGYVPEEAGAPQYAVIKKNGNLAYKGVAEVWKEKDRRCALILAIGDNDHQGWAGMKYRDSDGEFLGRLQVDTSTRSDIQVTDIGLEGISCPGWLPCPNGCDVCQATCNGVLDGSLLLAGGELSYSSCVAGCGKFGNPYAAVACGAICLGLIGIGVPSIINHGCGDACRNLPIHIC